MTLDETDLAILRCLQIRGKITHRELSEVVGLSPSRCCERVQRLENDGVIVGYRPVFDWTRIDGGLWALVEVAVDGDIQACNEFAEFVRASEVVAGAYRLAQPHIFVLNVAALSMGAWRAFLVQAQHSGHNIRVTQLNVVMEPIGKEGGPVSPSD